MGEYCILYPYKCASLLMHCFNPGFSLKKKIKNFLYCGYNKTTVPVYGHQYFINYPWKIKISLFITPCMVKPLYLFLTPQADGYTIS